MRYLPILLLPILIVGCSKAPPAADASGALPVLFPAPQFTLTDENDRPFGSDQLKGKVWVATLFYTTCPGPCPMMSAKMKHIQNAVNNPDVLLVSVSVDPDHDSPSAMKSYAEAMGADEKRWFFLTGGAAKTQEVADGLKLGFEPAGPGKPLMHATQFLLFDRAGQCRGIYHTDDGAEMEKIAADARALATS